MKHRLILAPFVLVALAATPSISGSRPDTYFMPRLTAGDRYSNVYSTQFTLRIHGRTPVIYRSGGSAVTQVLAVSAHDIRIRTTWSNPGTAKGSDIENVDPLTRERIIAGKLNPVLGANGFTPASELAGAPARIAIGSEWTTTLGASGYLPASTQTVHVLYADPASTLIILRRTGIGIGAGAPTLHGREELTTSDTATS